MMKRVIFCCLVFASVACAQVPVMTDITYPGRITWTNNPDSNALYRIEWAPSPQGPWNFSFDALGGGAFRNIQGSTNTQFSADIPMVFRVRMITNTPPPGMVLIPGGRFEMGNHFPAEAQADQLPVHTVEVSDFWITPTEVTQSEWNWVLAWAINNGYQFNVTNTYNAPNTDVPANYRNWYDVAKWCNAKSEMEGRQPAYWWPDGMFAWTFRTGEIATVEFWHDASGYRMPTEAEWEYAARGGLIGKRFPHGDTIAHVQENYDSTGSFDYDISLTSGYHPNSSNFWAHIMPVGLLAPNGYGLYDMGGNIREMCSDRYASNYYSWGVVTNPVGPSGVLYSDRVARGGIAEFDASVALVALRMYVIPNTTTIEGFRLVTPLQE